MTDPSVPPSAAPEQPAPSASGFFGWVRGLGIVRSDGWIGGVASGIAVRIGIDPIIVRGLFVVLSLLGVPMVLLYAVAWALLPDANGSIHLQNMFRGRFDPPMIAILVIVVLNFFPVIPAVLGFGLWPLSGLFSDNWSYGWSSVSGAGSVILSLALVALVIVAIIKMSKNRSQRAAQDQTGPYAGYTQTGYPTADGTGHHQGAAWQNAPANPYAGQAPVAPQGYGAPQAPVAPQGYGAPQAPGAQPPAPQAPAAPQGFVAAPGTEVAAPDAAGRFPDVTVAPAAAPADATAPAAAPLAPPAAATATAPAPGYDEWRRQHENWLGTSEQWKAQQADAEKRARQQARTEAIARGQELSRQASEQAKARRAANPRMSFGFVAAVIGVAVIAAAIVALVVAPQGPFLAATAALLVAGVVGSLGMVLAGLLRRRSGFLTFLTVTTLAFALPMGFLAAPFATDAKTAFALTSSGPDSLVAVGSMNIGGTSSEDREFVQFFGYTDVYVSGPFDGETDRGDISIVKGGGRTDIYVAPGTELELEAVLADGTLTVYSQDPDTGEFSSAGMETGTVGADGRVFDLTLRAEKGEKPTATQAIDITQADDVTVYLEVEVKDQN